MKIIAHRGYWEKKEQQNTYDAIFLGLVYADGIEIDLRIYNNKIIISHDHQFKRPFYYLEEILELSKEFPHKWWALNVKEDGLSSLLADNLKRYPELNYFCFDMSFPETFLYIKKKIKIASRISDLEQENMFVSKNSIFYIHDHFEKFKKLNKTKKNIMIISPELHSERSDFNSIKKLLDDKKNNYFLCTDRTAQVC